MKGSITRIREGVYRLRYDAGIDARTGKRRQPSITFRGTEKKAHAKLRDLCSAVDNDTYVEASKLTIGQWLVDWLDATRSRIRPATYVRYKGIIDNAITKAPIATIPIQKLRPAHIEAYTRV
jgi:hypothetical protein